MSNAAHAAPPQHQYGGGFQTRAPSSKNITVNHYHGGGGGGYGGGGYGGYGNQGHQGGANMAMAGAAGLAGGGGWGVGTRRPRLRP